jgi:hypothetical protein
MQVAPSTPRASILLTRIAVGSGLIQDRGRSVAPRSALAARVRSGDQGGVQHAREHGTVTWKTGKNKCLHWINLCCCFVFIEFIFVVDLFTLNSFLVLFCLHLIVVLLTFFLLLFTSSLFCQHFVGNCLFGETVVLSYKELIIATNFLLTTNK